MSPRENPYKPTVLVVPLDWGLGHATRCIPIVRALLANNCSVLLAGEGSTRCLLQAEFPELVILELKGYRVRFSKKTWLLPFRITAQVPSIIKSINYEHRWLKKAIEEYNIDVVISDNRFGLYHFSIPTAFITHQLFIKTGFGSIIDAIVQRLNYRFINRFTECWIPDNYGMPNLANELSHPVHKPSLPLYYIGTLSRFATTEMISEGKHLLFIISGPEPQRTLLEKLIMEQLQSYTRAVVIVRGKPGTKERMTVADNVQVFDHLPALELREKILQASFVISRCGYSTIMDMTVLKKKTIYIPTPGQAEQEYLAKHLMKNNLALCIDQNKFKLKSALDLAASFRYNSISLPDNTNNVVEGFLSRIKNRAFK